MSGIIIYSCYYYSDFIMFSIAILIAFNNDNSLVTKLWLYSEVVLD
jgi:hypothetical protein